MTEKEILALEDRRSSGVTDTKATPGMFAWLSRTEWRVGAARCHGEDQEIWSPDLLARGGQSARR